ncbi:MAG: response regulator [Lentimicrobium sp.]|nr:response regulator [Lentimicrobium sp.]
MDLQSNKRLMPLLAITMLILITASVIFAFLVRQKQKVKISAALEILFENRQPVILVENTLESLFLAENEFKEYALSYDTIHFLNYKLQVMRLINSLDTLQTITKAFGADEKESDVSTIIDERNREADSYIRLKRLTDSLVIISANIELSPFENPEKTINIKKITPSSGGIFIDTLDFMQTTDLKKKGLLGKIKTFLVGESEQQTTTAKVVLKTEETQLPSEELSTVHDTTFNVENFTLDILNKSNIYYQRQLRNYVQRGIELRQSELKIIRLNNRLLSEIRKILFDLKNTVSQKEGINSSTSASTIIRSTNILHNSLLIAAVGALILGIVTALMMKKIQKHQERLLESKQKALTEADEKRRFLAYMSHEFRTPLTSVIGFAEQLEQAGLTNEQMEYLSGIISSSEILLTTVNDILDLSKLDSGKMKFMKEPFRPAATIKQTIRAFKGSAEEKGLSISFARLADESILVGDEVRLKQILNNLVSNAVKYTIKGKIGIKAEIENGSFDKKWLTISIKDTGIGIPSENLNEIFDEYVRVHTETSARWVIGTGLGLPVTKKLIESLGGSIKVNSKVGQGTEFLFSLPYEFSEDICNETYKVKPIQNFADSGLKLLVADDNFFNILLLKTIFKRAGIEVTVAENGKDALLQIETGNYNILLSDMYMPGMNGIDLTRAIRENKEKKISSLPVLMITGEVSEDAKKVMLEAGVNDYLFKPFQQSDLLGLIGKYVH